MEIDLREIQALHARYAREPVIIDLESLVRARPAPLLLAHDLNVKSTVPSPLRRAWDARANVGRAALMVVGGTVLSAAIGMGAAAAWSRINARHAASIPTPTAQATPAAAVGQAAPDDVADGEPANAVRPLTSRDLGTQSARAAALSSVDPASLLRSATPAAAAKNDQTNGGRTAASADEQRAIASPLRQHILGRTAQSGPAAVAPMHIPPARASEPAQAPSAPAKAVEQPTQSLAAASVTPAAQPERAQAPAPVHRAARHRAPSPQQTGSSSDVKSAPAASTAPQHGGDVQLF